MAFKFTPRTDAELEQEEKKREEALLLPEGDYDFELIEAKERISSKGNPMIEARLKVFHGDSVRFVTDYLMEAMAFKLRHFAESVGRLEEYNSGEFDATNLVGASGVVKIKIEPAKGQFSAKNSVKDYAVRGGSARVQSPVDSEVDQSEIPF